VNRSAFQTPLAKVLVLVLCVGAFAAWAIWPRHLPRPDEKNRLYHPEDAYSIIVPPGWTMSSFEISEHTLTNDRGWMKLEPLNAGKNAPSLMIHVMTAAPDDKYKQKEGFTDGTFQGRPALVKSFHQHWQWGYSFDFQKQDKWFDMCLMTPDYYDAPNSDWWPYLQSFKYEPEKAKKLTSPTTVPTMTFPTTLPSDLTK
jgi:hypothetical protein